MDTLEINNEPQENVQQEIEDSFREYEQYLNQQVVVMLKDNKFYYGILKSFDQYNSITLNYSVERIFYENMYAEKYHGLLVIRGDTISLIGISQNNFKNYKKQDFNFIFNLLNNKLEK